MNPATVNLAIPFELLTDTIKTLDFVDQQKLLALLEAEIAAVEETMVDENDALRKEMREARAAYDAGDYLTLNEYIVKHERND